MPRLKPRPTKTIRTQTAKAPSCLPTSPAVRRGGQAHGKKPQPIIQPILATGLQPVPYGETMRAIQDGVDCGGARAIATMKSPTRCEAERRDSVGECDECDRRGGGGLHRGANDNNRSRDSRCGAVAGELDVVAVSCEVKNRAPFLGRGVRGFFCGVGIWSECAVRKLRNSFMGPTGGLPFSARAVCSYCAIGTRTGSRLHKFLRSEN